MKDSKVPSPSRSLIAHIGSSCIRRQESCMIEVMVLAFKLSMVQSRTPFRASTLPLEETEKDTRDTVSLCSLPNGRSSSDPRSRYRSASSSATELVIGGGGEKPSL